MRMQAGLTVVSCSTSLSNNLVFNRSSLHIGNGTCFGAGGTNGWLCQHRWTPIAGMIGFHNEAGTAPLTNWVTGTSGQIAFGRGKQKP